MSPVYHPNYWRRHFQGQFVPALNQLIDVLECRLLPTLKQADINNEAQAVADEVWEGFMSMPATGDEDPSDFADAAQEAGLDHFLLMTEIRQGVVNMFAAGLYHTFEQQLLYFHREELVDYGHQNNPAQLKLSKVMERLNARGIELAAFKSWAVVKELRLLANTVKHAEGASADELRRLRPDLFEDPSHRGVGLDVGGQTRRPIYLPLVGEDLFVSVDDLSRYRDALTDFWRELDEALSDA